MQEDEQENPSPLQNQSSPAKVSSQPEEEEQDEGQMESGEEEIEEEQDFLAVPHNEVSRDINSEKFWRAAQFELELINLPPCHNSLFFFD